MYSILHKMDEITISFDVFKRNYDAFMKHIISEYHISLTDLPLGHALNVSYMDLQKAIDEMTVIDEIGVVTLHVDESVHCEDEDYPDDFVDESDHCEDEDDIVDESDHCEDEDDIVDESDHCEDEDDIVDESDHCEDEDDIVDESDHCEDEDDIVDESDHCEDEDDIVDKTDHCEDEDDIVDKTDHCEPHKYRDFMVYNDESEHKVNEFYDHCVKYVSTIPGNNNFVMESLTYSETEDKLKILYAQTDMWAALARQDYTEPVIFWAESMKKYIVSMVQTQLLIIETISGKMHKGQYVQDEVFRVLIQYDKIFKAENLAFNKFRKTFLMKAIELMRDGLASSILVFANYHPDLVSDQIYPILYHDNSLYSDSNLAILEKSPVYGQLYEKYENILHK